MRVSNFQRRARALLLERGTWDGKQVGHPGADPDAFGVVLQEIGRVIAALLSAAVVTNLLPF
jgi:hypothetical protein